MIIQASTPTTNNVVLGTGLTLLIFISIVSITTGLAFGPYFVIAFVVAFVVSTIGATVMAPAGVGLVWLALRILSHTASRLAHTTGVFVAGAVTGALAGALVGLLFLTPIQEGPDLWSILTSTGIFALITGVSATAGWLLATMYSGRAEARAGNSKADELL